MTIRLVRLEASMLGTAGAEMVTPAVISLRDTIAMSARFTTSWITELGGTHQADEKL